MMSLVASTGGKYFLANMPNAGKAAMTLPTQYRSNYVYQNMIPDCSVPQTFYFPVDSETQTVVANIISDLDDGYPKYTSPNGDPYSFAINNIYNDIGVGSRVDQLIKGIEFGRERVG